MRKLRGKVIISYKTLANFPLGRYIFGVMFSRKIAGEGRLIGESSSIHHCLSTSLSGALGLRYGYIYNKTENEKNNKT